MILPRKPTGFTLEFTAGSSASDGGWISEKPRSFLPAILLCTTSESPKKRTDREPVSSFYRWKVSRGTARLRFRRLLRLTTHSPWHRRLHSCQGPYASQKNCWGLSSMGMLKEYLTSGLNRFPTESTCADTTLVWITQLEHCYCSFSHRLLFAKKKG